MKKQIKRKFDNTKLQRSIKFELNNKYYNIFRNKFEVNGIDDQFSEDYLFNKLYGDGGVLICSPDGLGPQPFNYSVESFGLHYRPTKVRITDNFGIGTLNQGPYIVDVDGVLGFLQPSKKGLKMTIDYYIDRMAQILMALYINVETSKLPFLVGVNEDDIDVINDILDRIYNNELAIFCTSEQVNQLKVLNTGGSIEFDRFWQQYLNYECDLLTALGIDCNALNMARITSDQANANNSLINNINDGFDKCLKQMTDKVNSLFGVNWSIKVKQPKVDSIHDDIVIEEDEGGEDDGRDN